AATRQAGLAAPPAWKSVIEMYAHRTSRGIVAVEMMSALNGQPRNRQQRWGYSVRCNPASALVAGAGFEPATFAVGGQDRARREPTSPNWPHRKLEVVARPIGPGWSWLARVHGQNTDS